MSNQRRPVVVVLIIGAFFAAGLLTVLLGGDSIPEPADIPETNATESILILGVDNLSAPDPKLVAVWQATYSYSNRDVILFGRSIDSAVCADSDAVLSDIFAWEPTSGVAPEFLDEFKDVPLVVVDEVAFSALIDQLGGVGLNGATLHGDQVTAVMRTLYGNPAGLLTSQEQFLIALAAKAASDSGNVDLNQLLELIPSHSYTSVPPQDLLTTYLRLQPLDPGSILIWASTDSPDPCES